MYVIIVSTVSFRGKPSSRFITRPPTGVSRYTCHVNGFNTGDECSLDSYGRSSSSSREYEVYTVNFIVYATTQKNLDQVRLVTKVG